MAPGHSANTRPVSGIVLVDKTAGLSSNRVLQQTKRLFRARKAGHTGTLDPLATGMLPVCLGNATRVAGLMLDASKRYRVTAEFGVATDTGDAEGIVVARHELAEPKAAALAAALAQFRGQIEQVPPMFSALKVGGRRLYELARSGIELPRAARVVEIHELEVHAIDWPRLDFEVHCSKGTYIRSLVVDIAAALGTAAHVRTLRRLAVGPFGESGMVTLEALEQAAEIGLEALDRHLIGADAALVDWPALEVTTEEMAALRHGRQVRPAGTATAGMHRIYDPRGGFIGIAEVDGEGLLRPRRIFPESTLG